MALKWLTSVRTLGRKIQKSLVQRGVVGTGKRFLSKPVEMAGTYLRGLSSSHRRCRREEIDFDRQMQIDTCARTDPGWMAKIASANWMHGIGYAPVPIRDARTLLADLDLCYEDYVCIDMGAGKGRMLFLAAEFPFRRIIGVEYSRDLHATLTHNIQSFRNPAQRCRRIEGELQDAAQYVFPLDPLVLFFHHPFDDTIFRQVIANLERSLDECPRDVRVIYYDPTCGELFRRSEYFQVSSHGTSDPAIRYSSNWTIYVSRVPVQSV